jgi:hypothetical protein
LVARQSGVLVVSCERPDVQTRHEKEQDLRLKRSVDEVLVGRTGQEADAGGGIQANPATPSSIQSKNSSMYS